MMKRVAMIAGWLVASCAFGQEPGSVAATNRLKYQSPQFLAGSIYSIDGKKLLFRFERHAVRHDSRLSVTRDFVGSDGKVAAREKVEYEGNRLLSFELDDQQTGAHGQAELSVEAHAARPYKVTFRYSKSGPDEHPRVERLAEEPLIGDMVGPFLLDHWKELSRGETVPCRYIVPERKETVGFEFKMEPAANPQTPELVTVRMSPANAVIKMLVEPPYFKIEKRGDHHVLEYTGRTTPKQRVGTKWKDLDAVTRFDWATASP